MLLTVSLTIRMLSLPSSYIQIIIGSLLTIDSILAMAVIGKPNHSFLNPKIVNPLHPSHTHTHKKNDSDNGSDSDN